MNYQTITLHTDQQIATITLNRPDKLNAMNFDMLRELIDVAGKLSKYRHLRCILIQGAGKSFSAGLDLAELGNQSKIAWAIWQLIKPGQSVFQRACLVWQDLPIPVIAVIHGNCFGAGMQLALGADIRITSSDSQLSIREGRWGLIPDMGLTQSIQGLVPVDVVKLLTYSAKLIDPADALKYGLVTEVADDPMTRALALASEFAQQSPDALKGAKSLFHTMTTRPMQALRREKMWQLKLLLGKNSAIARRAGREELPRYQDRQF